MRLSVLALTLTLGLAPAATAAPITFTFTATQTSASTPGGLASLAAPFATITGTITYDLATAASSSDATLAVYPTGALSVGQFNVGTGVFTAPFSSPCRTRPRGQVEAISSPCRRAERRSERHRASTTW